MEVISLLQNKNRCLQKFLRISLEFSNRAEQGDLENLAEFEREREITLKAIDLFDRKISENVVMLSDDDRTPELIEMVKNALSAKEDMIHRILEVDLKIISIIEKEKSRLLQELTHDKKNKDTLSKFKSKWVAESGEGFDTKL